jgi:WD40 repeat protein
MALEGERYPVQSVTFSPDGMLLVAATCDAMVHMWSMPTRDLRRTLDQHVYAVYSVAFSPDGQLLGLGAAEEPPQLWHAHDLTSKRILLDASAPEAFGLSVAFAPDGTLLASGDSDGVVRLWRVGDGQLVRALHGHTDAVWSVAFSPDGSLLASGASDATVRLWSLTDRDGDAVGG